MSEKPADPSLELVTTCEMLDELSRRFDTMVFLGDATVSDHAGYVTCRYHGSALAVLGMLHVATRDASDGIQFGPDERARSAEESED
jgi:hypothetical protein